MRPAPSAVGWIIILAASLLSGFIWRISRSTLILGAIVFTAGYSMVVLGFLSRDHFWLPTFLPLALLWFLVVVRVFSSHAGTKHEIAAAG